MGMGLQDAIDFASDPANGQAFGLDTDVVVTMHDETASRMEAAGVEPAQWASPQEVTAFGLLLIRSIRSNGPLDTRITHTDGPPTRLYHECW
jgi:hypothetical protein